MAPMGRYARQGFFMRLGQCSVKKSCIAHRNRKSNLQLIQFFTSGGFGYHSPASASVSLSFISL